MFTEKQINCVSCGNDFAFTAEEQEFFHSKGFQDPRKCKPCRQAAKQARRGGGGGGYDRGPRQLFDAVCASCGVDTQVPFQPSGAKPVYCRECFQNQQSSYY
ncbi:MAG: zinc-ribbon domain containing protein [Vampirovibrio sp.]|nr:zinc-ribbon domain containing protein [Vampirovibrio sp.]